MRRSDLGQRLEALIPLPILRDVVAVLEELERRQGRAPRMMRLKLFLRGGKVRAAEIARHIAGE